MSAGLRLTRVEAGGVADRAGLRPGDRLLTIDGHAIEDQIDVQFHSSASRLRLRWRRGRATHKRGVRVGLGEPFGWEFEPFRPRRCTNRCPFCFCLQQPPGLRKSLAFRDEDFRLSFLYGHYITGTNLTGRDLERIVRQRLSPLYISVHATEPGLRARMLGRRRLPPISDLLDRLASHDIAFHTQIVLCPGWNDGPALERTLDDLQGYFPALQSVAIVPVGLTCHRDRLPHIRRVTPRYAARTIDKIEPVMRKWRRALGERVLFLADEWYLRAKRPVPTYRGIDVAPQFENGVGMVADFLRPWPRVEKRLPKSIVRGDTGISPVSVGGAGIRPPSTGGTGILPVSEGSTGIQTPIPGSTGFQPVLPRHKRNRSVAIVTGVTAAPALRPIVERLNAIEGLHVTLVVVRNRLFGPTVTVSGLLGGSDIRDALLARRRADRYLLPANCLRPWDNLFLDDLTLDDLASALDRPILPIDGTCRDLAKAVIAAPKGLDQQHI